MEYVQVGMTALRTPTGDFMTPVPLFIRKEDIPLVSTEGDEVRDVSKLFAEKFKEYVDRNKKSTD